MAFKDFTPAQRKEMVRQFNHNIKSYGVQVDFDERALKFVQESTHRNWLYYAGFEYIKDGFDISKSRNGKFSAVYYAESDRVADVIEALENAPEIPEATEIASA